MAVDANDLMEAFTPLEDVLAEISVSKMKTPAEHRIYLGVKTVKNMIDAAMDRIGIGAQSDIAKAKGVIASAVRSTTALIGQIKGMGNTASRELQRVEHALATSLRYQSKVLKEI